ncbi:MAG: TIGR03617 family F420-dependent LLM class oxidoreductase [Acidimicrobiales bacterium]|nr:TIGR03617 family F420-dependent LLM class oxidoreductase [Acidimicrobiales bacterium]
MRIDGAIPATIADAGAQAAHLEALGYDGGMVAELASDPFLPLVAAGASTERLQLGTGIAVAFARSPMTLANTAFDLQQFTKGRFVLGLGSQIKPHITKRFSMPWSKPAARMRELIQAMHAIWDNWYDGTPLQFRGEFYQHTLMTPMFTPAMTEFARPKVYLAGVGPLMTEVAGEVADGFIAHAFTTASYFEAITLPALEAGLASSGRTRSDLDVSMPVFIVPGETDAERAENAQPIRQQLAFYGSTPAYAGVLEHHGWDGLQPELNAMSKQGQWVEMADKITDEILDQFAVQGPVTQLPRLVHDRYGSLLDRLQFSTRIEADALPEFLGELRALRTEG